MCVLDCIKYADVVYISSLYIVHLS